MARYPLGQPTALRTGLRPPLTAGRERAIVSAAAAARLEMPLPPTGRACCVLRELSSQEESRTRRSCEGTDLHPLGEAKLVRFWDASRTGRR